MFKRQILVMIVFGFATTLPLLASAGTHNSYFKTQNYRGDWHSAILNTPVWEGMSNGIGVKDYMSTSLPCLYIEGTDVRLHATKTGYTLPYDYNAGSYNDSYHALGYWPAVETRSNKRLSNGEREYYFREATHLSGNASVCGEYLLRIRYRYSDETQLWERVFGIE